MAADPKAKLEEMLHNLGFEATVEELDQPDGRVLNIITEEDSGRLIGRRGQTLIDLQYLLNRMVYNEDKETAKVLLDVAGYRFSARQSIVDQAKKAAEKVPEYIVSSDGHIDEPPDIFDELPQDIRERITRKRKAGRFVKDAGVAKAARTGSFDYKNSMRVVRRLWGRNQSGERAEENAPAP